MVDPSSTLKTMWKAVERARFGRSFFLFSAGIDGSFSFVNKSLLQVPGKFINLGNKKDDYNEFCRTSGRGCDLLKVIRLFRYSPSLCLSLSLPIYDDMYVCVKYLYRSE